MNGERTATAGLLVYKHRKALATTAETIERRSYRAGFYFPRGNGVTRVPDYRGVVAEILRNSSRNRINFFPDRIRRNTRVFFNTRIIHLVAH